MTTKGGELAVGDRVVLCGTHERAGATGVIWNSPGRVWNGWNVKLDGSDVFIGVDEKHIELSGCPVCYAQPGEACVTPAGSPRNDHMQRVGD